MADCGDKRVIGLGTHAEVTVVCALPDGEDHGHLHWTVDEPEPDVRVTYTWRVKA